MSTVRITLPTGDKIAGALDGQGDFVQATADTDLKASVDAVEAKLPAQASGRLPVESALPADALLGPFALTQGSTTGWLPVTKGVDRSVAVVQFGAANTNTSFEVQLEDGSTSIQVMHMSTGAGVNGNPSSTLNMISSATTAVLAYGRLNPRAVAFRLTASSVFSGSPAQYTVNISREPFQPAGGVPLVGLSNVGIVADTQGSLQGAFGNFDFNGGSWDRHRGNVITTVLGSGSRNTVVSTGDLTMHNASTVRMIVNVTAAGTGGLTPKIRAKTLSGAQYYDLLTGTKITSTGIYTFVVGPYAPSVPGSVVQGPIARTLSFVVTPDDSSSWTYAIDAESLV